MIQKGKHKSTKVRPKFTREISKSSHLRLANVTCYTIIVDLINVQRCLNDGIMAEISVPSHSDPAVLYNVVIQSPNDPEDIVCECEGYLYRGYCSHQNEALAQICGWTEFEEEEQTDDQVRQKICPRCGGPTEWRMIDADL